MHRMLRLCRLAIEYVLEIFQRNHIRKERKKTLWFEDICDLDLRVWYVMFGMPGMFNELNIMDLSTNFSYVLDGTFPSTKADLKIDGKRFYWLYYLTYGIYPPWKLFSKMFSSPENTKDIRTQHAKRL